MNWKKKSQLFERKSRRTRVVKKSLSLSPRSHLDTKTLEGWVKRHADGFGFFIPEDKSHADVYLPSSQMQGLMSGDRVKVLVVPRRGRLGLFSGKLLKITQRFHQYVVGQYQEGTGDLRARGIVKDTGSQWGEDIQILREKGQKYRHGAWVQVQITHWPGKRQALQGKVIHSLGVFSPGLEDNMRMIQKHSIPAVFSSSALEEAEKWPDSLSAKVLQNRKDLRSFPFVTIDGKTAKDFDDAICVVPQSWDGSCHAVIEKGWVLYVAIADVSYYVPLNSCLDREAYHRGNSTYFPSFVAPMLPEKLSNHLCSLKPHTDRLAMVAEIHFNPQGERQKTSFYPAVIHTQARLNYTQAQNIIDNFLEKRDSKNPVSANVFSASQLARQLLKRRLKNHFIDLDIPETEVRLDKWGEPVDIVQSQRLFSHQMIEECMLSANQAVAEFIYKKKAPSIYRVHAGPQSESLQLVESFAQTLGVSVTLSPPCLQQKISQLIKQVAHHPVSQVLQILVLRALSQALYSHQRREHFGLNFHCYTHFTSPIRRYSDLVVHRTLKALLDHQSLPYSLGELESIASITSACEGRSVKAERQIKDIKKARFIKKYLGATMEGAICSVTKFGFFVTLRLYPIDGLVRIESLPGRWEFKESLLQLWSRKGGISFQIGDLVQIQILSSNIETGQVELGLKKHQKSGLTFKKNDPIGSHEGLKDTNFKRIRNKKRRTHKMRRKKMRAQKTKRTLS